MLIRRVIVEIKIDEDNIRHLYPDFDLHYETVEEFLEAVFDSIESDDEDSLEKFGYSAKIMESINFDHLITFSKN